MKDSFYRLNEQVNKPVNIIISNLGFGKSYRELLKLKRNYEDSNKHLKFINKFNENVYPPRYYMNKGAIELIDYLLGDDENETNS